MTDATRYRKRHMGPVLPSARSLGGSHLPYCSIASNETRSVVSALPIK
jgi:hypothetical protein